MASKWSEVTADPEFQALPAEEKRQVQERYFKNVLSVDPDYNNLDDEGHVDVLDRFFSSAKSFLWTEPARGAAVLREFGADRVSPTIESIEQISAKTGEVPYGKILGRTVAETATAMIPLTPTEIAVQGLLGGLTTKYGPKALSLISEKYPNFTRVMTKGRSILGKGVTGEVAQPLASPGIEVPPALEARPASIPTVPPVQGGISPALGSTPKDVFPSPPGSYTESISQHPAFVKATDEAMGVVNKYAAARKMEATPQFADDLFLELHNDAKAAILKAKPGEDAAKALAEFNQKYPDFDKDFIALVNKRALHGNLAVKMTPEQQAVMQKKAFERIAGLPASATSEYNVFGGKPPVIPPEPQAATTPLGKPKQFVETIKGTPETPPELRAELSARDTTYQPITNKATLEKAQKFVAESPEEALTFINENAPPTADHTATAIELIKKFNREGKYGQAADVSDSVASRLTQPGQHIQAAKLYATLSPESVLVKASRLIRAANKDRFPWQKDITLSDEHAKQLVELAEKMKLATGDMKLELSDEIYGILRQIPESSIGKKLASAQTIAQLLNPKTILARNPLGNEIFYRLERMNKYVTTPIDIVRSKLTGGPREVTFHTVGQGGYWKNWMRGARAGWKGIAPEGRGTQFEISAPAFKSKLNPLTYMEKALGATLRSFDEAAFARGANETIGELAYLKALNEGKKGAELTAAAKKYLPEMEDRLVEISKEYGKYVTFQDDNLISKGLQSIKKGLNLGQDFGMGDLILKYPKTPGALLHRALEYSPAGFLRSAKIMAEPFLTKKPANVREAEIALGRAITGTLGLTGFGYYLADKGVITGKRKDAKVVMDLDQTTGSREFQVNMSAVKRWARSGFKDASITEQPGDMKYSYDWAQPVAVSLAIGANMNQNVKENILREEKVGVLAGTPGAVASSLSGAVESIAEQPMLQGLKNLFGGQSAIKSLGAVLQDIPATFTPTILNQMRQFEDPVLRETYSPKFLERVVNKVKSKTPGQSKDLPKKYTVLGEEQRTPENPTAFNVFLNPGFITAYKPTPAAQMVLEIYEKTGETKQFPRAAPKKLVFMGKTVELDGQQVSEFQKKIGQLTSQSFNMLAKDPDFKKKPDEEKANILNYILGQVYTAVKLSILNQDQKRALMSELIEDAK